MKCPDCGAPVEVVEYVCFGGDGNTYACQGDWTCGWQGKFRDLKLDDVEAATE